MKVVLCLQCLHRVSRDPPGAQIAPATTLVHPAHKSHGPSQVYGVAEGLWSGSLHLRWSHCFDSPGSRKEPGPYSPHTLHTCRKKRPTNYETQKLDVFDSLKDLNLEA